MRPAKGSAAPNLACASSRVLSVMYKSTWLRIGLSIVNTRAMSPGPTTKRTHTALRVSPGLASVPARRQARCWLVSTSAIVNGVVATNMSRSGARVDSVLPGNAAASIGVKLNSSTRVQALAQCRCMCMAFTWRSLRATTLRHGCRSCRARQVRVRSRGRQPSWRWRACACQVVVRKAQRYPA